MVGPSPSAHLGSVNQSVMGPAPGTTNSGDEVGLMWINVMTYVFLSSVMFGIGSAVEIQQLKNVILKRKIAFAVGMTSQYLVVPAAARLVVSALDMPVLHAFAIILIGCCPGGAVSNAFALFCKSRLFRRRESVRLGPASHLELKTVQEVWYCLFAPHYSLTIAASISYTFSRLSINTTIDTNSERRCSLVHRHDHSIQHSGLCDAPTAIVYLDSGIVC